MRDRVELLVGGAIRAMWVMTFHSACARMLRADAHRLGYTRQFTIYDSADSRRLIKKCLDDLDIDPKRFTPARDAGADLRRQEQAPLGRGLPRPRRLVLRADGGRRLRALRARAPPRQRDGLRRPPVPRGRPAPALPGGPRPLRQRLPLDPRRRVPGHEPRPVPLARAAGGRAPQPRGGRRRRPVDLRLPRRGHPEHPRVRGRLPRRPRRAAGAELPLHADHPQRRQRGRRQQPRAQGQVAVDGDRRGRPDQGPRAAPTSTPRRASWWRRSSGSSTRASRAPSSPSSTAPTRSRACSRTCSCARRSATRSSAARSSTSGRRSRTRSPT